MEWMELTVKTTTEATEAVANILYDAGVKGVVIEDPKDFDFVNQDQKIWDYVEEEVYTFDFEGALIKGYLPKTEGVADEIQLIKHSIAYLPHYGMDIGEGTVETKEVKDEDWSNTWKQYYKPARIGKYIIIKPEWEDYEKKTGDIVIEMNPGMAFGTGTHETTTMCIEALEEVVTKEDLVFDIGCGSGILGVVAAKLGAKKVVAVDFDEVAVGVARENVENNHVTDLVSVYHGNLMDNIDEKGDIILVNIIADVIITMAPDFQHYLKPSGTLITSGIILEKIEPVKKALKTQNIEVYKTVEKGEWAALYGRLKEA